MKKITQGVNGKLTAFRSASPKANYFGNFIEKKKKRFEVCFRLLGREFIYVYE